MYMNAYESQAIGQMKSEKGGQILGVRNFPLLFNFHFSCKTKWYVNRTHPRRFPSSSFTSKYHKCIFKLNFHHRVTKFHLFQHMYVFETSSLPTHVHVQNFISSIQTPLKHQRSLKWRKDNETWMKLPPPLSYLLLVFSTFNSLYPYKLEILVFIIVDCLFLIDYVEGSDFC